MTAALSTGTVLKTVIMADRKRIINELTRVATGDIVSLWKMAANHDAKQFRRIIEEGFPEIVAPYASAANEFAMDWYDASGPGLKYKAVSGELPDPDALKNSATWALGADGNKALKRLTGTMQRAINRTAGDTIMRNVKNEGRTTRWARSVSADCCAWCAMLATSGARYLSEETGSFDAHPFCGCQAVEIRPGQSWEPSSWVKDFDDKYLKAREEVGTGDPNGLVAHMRAALGPKHDGTHRG